MASSLGKLSAVAEELGHQIRVFTNAAAFPPSNEASAASTEEADDFYDFTPEDYYRIMAVRIGGRSEILKTRKMRDAEAEARRARINKAVIRVRFPDNYILEAKFQPIEKIQSLIDLLKKVVARPDLPFYLYTTPPKERIKDASKDFYTAGFAPGAIVYFSYDLAKDTESHNIVAGPYLRDDILSLNGLELNNEPLKPAPEQKVEESIPVEHLDPRPAKKPTKPKWLKL